jgi:hypothetical protein
VAEALSGVVPDSNRRMIYEFAMHRLNRAEFGKSVEEISRRLYETCRIVAHLLTKVPWRDPTEVRVTASFRKFCSLLTAMLVLLVSVNSAAAEDHVVPLRELERQLRQTAEQRARNMADIERVLSYPAAAQEFAKYNVTGDQVHQAVATLTDSELARLADRARDAEKDVQGGFIVGILALIGLIVVIIIVVALVAQAMPQGAGTDTYASMGNGGVNGWASVPQIAPVHS